MDIPIHSDRERWTVTNVSHDLLQPCGVNSGDVGVPLASTTSVPSRCGSHQCDLSPPAARIGLQGRMQA